MQMPRYVLFLFKLPEHEFRFLNHALDVPGHHMGRETLVHEAAHKKTAGEVLYTVRHPFLCEVDRVDVFTINGGNESLRKMPCYFPVELVGLFFQYIDLFEMAFRFIRVFHDDDEALSHPLQNGVLFHQQFEKRNRLGQETR